MVFTGMAGNDRRAAHAYFQILLEIKDIDSGQEKSLA